MSDEAGPQLELRPQVARTFGAILDKIDQALAGMGVPDPETQRGKAIIGVLERSGMEYSLACQAAYKEYGLGKLSLLQEAAVFTESIIPGVAKAFSLKGLTSQAVEYFIPAFVLWTPADILGLMRGWDILQVHPDRKWEAVLKLITAGFPGLPTTIMHSYLDENAARRFATKYYEEVMEKFNVQ